MLRLNWIVLMVLCLFHGDASDPHADVVPPGFEVLMLLRRPAFLQLSVAPLKFQAPYTSDVSYVLLVVAITSGRGTFSLRPCLQAPPQAHGVVHADVWARSALRWPSTA